MRLFFVTTTSLEASYNFAVIAKDMENAISKALSKSVSKAKQQGFGDMLFRVTNLHETGNEVIK